MLKKIVAVIVLIIFSSCFQTLAATPVRHTENTSIRLFRISQNEFLAKFTIKPDWHIYWLNPGEIGKPTIVSSEDTDVQILNSSVPEIRIFYDTLQEYIHKNSAYYLLSIQDPNASEITFSFAECNDVCQSEKLSFDLDKIPVLENGQWEKSMLKAKKTFPEKIKLTSPLQRNELILDFTDAESLNFIPAKTQIVEADSVVISKTDEKTRINWLDSNTSKLSQALIITQTNAFLADIEYKDIALSSLIYIVILAFLGGIILNAMPCVFPILSLKIFSLIKHQGDRKRATKEAVGYTCGVLFSFLFLTACIVYLKNQGENVGWGFQLQ